MKIRANGVEIEFDKEDLADVLAALKGKSKPENDSPDPIEEWVKIGKLLNPAPYEPPKPMWYYHPPETFPQVPFWYDKITCRS